MEDQVDEPAGERRESLSNLLLSHILVACLVKSSQRAVDEDPSRKLAEKVSQVLNIIHYHFVFLTIVVKQYLQVGAITN